MQIVIYNMARCVQGGLVRFVQGDIERKGVVLNV